MRLNFITVSRNPERVRSLESSLDAALGSEPSLHASLEVIDGPRLDLFRGYNAGAARTRDDILVFLHDDVRLLGNSLTFQEPLAISHRVPVKNCGSSLAGRAKSGTGANCSPRNPRRSGTTWI